MRGSDEVRRCLVELDIAGIRRAWGELSPHQPVPIADDHVLIALHHARTQTQSVPFKLRAYSHCWLMERGLPSGLPDRLRPRAQRIYPVVAEAVGIAVSSASPIMRPILGQVRTAMSDAVKDAYADGKRDPVFIKGRVLEARDKTIKKLVG